MRTRLRAAMMIIENEQLLLLRYIYPGGDLYALPGGNVEHSETLIQAVEREAEEELNLQVQVGSLFLVCETLLPEEDFHVIHLIFDAQRINGMPTLQSDYTTANEVCWLPIEKVTEIHTYPNISPIFPSVLSNRENYIYRQVYRGVANPAIWL